MYIYISNTYSHYIIISYTKSYYTNHPSFYHQLRHKPDPLRLWQLKDQFPQRQRGDQRNDEDSYAEDVDTTAYNCIQPWKTLLKMGSYNILYGDFMGFSPTIQQEISEIYGFHQQKSMAVWTFVGIQWDTPGDCTTDHPRLVMVLGYAMPHRIWNAVLRKKKSHGHQLMVGFLI